LKLKAADYIISIAPIWWGSVPAILNGYFDRVFAPGVTFAVANGKIKGLFGGKKGLNIFSVGAPEGVYKAVPDAQ
jgi:putative NADPH-quinone reductase